MQSNFNGVTTMRAFFYKFNDIARLYFHNMFGAMSVGAVIMALGLAACGGNDLTDPTEDQGWQVVFQAKDDPNSRGYALSGVRPNSFTELSQEWMKFLDGANVHSLEGKNDTAWVAYATSSVFGPENFRSGKINWTFSGSFPIGAEDSKIWLGPAVAFYQLDTYDDEGNLVAVMMGGHALALQGDDFLFTEQFDNTGMFRVITVVIARPVVCRQPAVRKIASGEIAELLTDGLNRVSNRDGVPEVTITCNPPVPATLRLLP